MAFTGILEALKKGPVTNSPLYVFTDAPPKDVALFDAARVKTDMLGVPVYFFLTNGCGDKSRLPAVRGTCQGLLWSDF